LSPSGAGEAAVSSSLKISTRKEEGSWVAWLRLPRKSSASSKSRTVLAFCFVFLLCLKKWKWVSLGDGSSILKSNSFPKPSKSEPMMLRDESVLSLVFSLVALARGSLIARKSSTRVGRLFAGRTPWEISK